VASIVGGAPFFSDVRVFNTSYASGLNVTAAYHCFIPSPCAAGIPQIAIALAPRESKSFDDMVANAFAAPNTAGGVEFTFSGSENQLVVTSRLYSTAPTPTVGMFIPGLEPSRAQSTTVLTSIRNGGPVKGFRTNVGYFNSNDASASVTFHIFDGGAPVGNPVTQATPGHSGVQVSGIFGAAGVGTLVTSSAVIVATATVPVFTYAAVIDNNTTDPIFVVGAPDQPPQAVPGNATVHVGLGGTNFVDEKSGTSITTVAVGSTVTWVWEPSNNHGTTSGTCTGGPGPYGSVSPQGYGSGCTPSGLWTSGINMAPHTYSFTFTQAGSYAYFCNVHLNAMTGRVTVTAPAASAKTEDRATAR
jgi:plastocyanin